MLAAGALLAQDGAEKATVPLHDPSRPARIEVKMMLGGVKVRGADVRDVTVEARGGSELHERREAGTDGMKRLDLGGSGGLDVVEDNNVVTIKAMSWNRPSDLVIVVPRRSSLELKCMNNGDIEVDGVDGEIDANNLNGGVSLKNVSGSVVAHSLNGRVLVTMDRVDASKPMSFSTLNGEIDVTLPGTVKANVLLKTDNGEIYSDFDVKLDGGPGPLRTEAGRQPDGTYHLRFDQALRGTINGGGPEFQFRSFNGQIYIRRRK
jgi:hypothetical protein